MEQKQAIDAALELSSLKFPDGLRIVGLEWDDYVDTAGEDAIRITIVMADETTDRDIAKGPIHEIKGVIMGSLHRHRVTLFPYMRFLRESELQELKQEA